ncbi:hypothetical protein [Actinophytocola sp.]|uniref:hypothetical protein n=1 Tax=Actinophytocola sp. TaxID=1872138 RepID=UPI002ED52B35
MRTTRAEVTTSMVDLTGLSLDELRSSDDPVLLRSLSSIVGRTERSRIGVLDNEGKLRRCQVPDGR